MTSRPSPHRVLVTGCYGAVGRSVCRVLLARGHFVRGFDREEDDGSFNRSGIPKPQLLEVVFADLSNKEALEKAMDSIDTVIHLAAVASEFYGPFEGPLLDVNFCGLNNVCQAAAAGEVQRLVLTSSVMVVPGIEAGIAMVKARREQDVFPADSTRPISVVDGTAPMGFYAASKVFAETLSGLYARGGPGGAGRKLSVIVARLGACVRNTEESMLVGEMQESGMNIFLSHDDAGRFYERCVEASAPEPGRAEIFFVMSKPPAGAPCQFDMDPAAEVLQYEPQDQWPQGLPFPGTASKV